MRTAIIAIIIFAAVLPVAGFARDDHPAVRRELSLMVPMRDGIRLSTDLYFPAGQSENLPAVLLRTPYGKRSAFSNNTLLKKLVERGYVVAIQDIRGRFESEGRYLVAENNRNDGYDTIEWLSTQPWSSKKVGTTGCSYSGDLQIVLAATRHPNHVASTPMASATGYLANGRPWIAFDGGAFELAQTAGWFAGSGTSVYYGPPPWVDRREWFLSEAASLFRQRPEIDYTRYYELIDTLPIDTLLDRSGLPPTEYKNFVTNSPVADYFTSREWVGQADMFDVPALFMDSWYDYGVAESFELFNLFQKNAASATTRNNQFIIIAPGTHCGFDDATEQTIVGERDLGDARLDFLNIQLRWHDHWLKGEDNGITEMPKVQYYLMGLNEWRSADAWPIPGTQYRKFFLHSGGKANSRFGDGQLSVDTPHLSGSDQFSYDPATPVPSLGGQSCCTGIDTAAGGYDQSETEARHDVLVYTSASLEEGIEVTGLLEVTLYVSSSAPDTDFTAKLVDVYPDGRAFNIQEGALRMRYREGFEKTVTMKVGEVYEARLNLHATSNYFGPGHKIRLEVSSSSFPRWDRNLNTGGENYNETEWKVAVNTVHHSEEYPSHIVLPVIE